MTRLILQPAGTLQPCGTMRETIQAFTGCRLLYIPVACTDNVEDDDVPVGDVPFCQSVMARQGIECPKPDFYPPWLSHWMHRIYVIQDQSHMASDRAHGSWFVKSADKYKDYPARVLHRGDHWPDAGRFIISEVVQFTQEWRYYVADGQVVTTGWYDGDDEDMPAPDLGIDWPAGFCGAVDFGYLSTGELALVECHPPFACGWYGDDPELFVLWLIAGWEWLRREYGSE